MVSTMRRGGHPQCPPNEIQSPTSSEEPPKVIRVVHQNVNGISSVEKFNEVGLVLGKVVNNEIDILTLNEINVNLQEKSVRSEYLNSYYAKHKQCVLQSAWAPTEIAAKKSRPGGNQVTLFGPLKSCIKEKAFDKIAGSWSSITVHTKRQPLTIISSYRVSQSSLKGIGEKTVYSQEYMALEANGVHAPEPRSRCLHELTDVVNKHVAQGHMVLLNLDANEDIASQNQLHAFSRDLNLNDLVATFSPQQTSCPTYKRGKKRIDYSFCTPDLLEFVVSARISTSAQVKDSDHRAIEVLLDHSKLMKKCKKSHRPTPRQLTQKNPASVRRYRELVEKYFKDHDLFRRIEMVKRRLEREPDMDDELKTELLNQLDEEKTKYLLAAERKCAKKKKYAVYQWSPILAQAGQEYSHAKHVLQDFLRDKVRGVQLAFAKEDVKLCRATLSDAQKTASELRDQHLFDIGELLRVARNTQAKYIVDEIKKVEEAMALARKLSPYNAKTRNGPLDSVLVPGAAVDSWVRLEEPSCIEDAILKQNQQDLEYAQQCPFLQSPLKEYLGNIGATSGADAFLQGTAQVDTSGYPNQLEVDTLLANLQKVTEHTLELVPTDKEYRTSYRKIRESTASSPSGLHYGHYKAAVETDVGKKVLHRLATLPFEHGLSLKRWQQSLHFMLQKKDLPYINKLRIIQLFEADFNTTLKLIYSRELMKMGDKLQINSDETYGARKGRNTHGALMIYQSNFGLAQLLKRNISILDSDATGCYDRIPHNLLTIAQQRIGCRKEFCVAHAKTLHHMVHKILTAHGISSKDFTKMLAGIGQGSSNGPSGWHSICELLMAAYRQLNPDGCKWLNPDHTIEVLVWLAGFVDDVVKFLGFLDHCSWEEALQSTQCAYQSWQNLLTATGGSLSLSKSSYTMVYWTVDKQSNEFKTVSKKERTGEIRMKADNQEVVIARKDPNEACKDLGILLAPDGNMKDQLRECIDRSKRIKAIISLSPITRQEASVFYHSRCMGWARYFLPITTFSKKQCHLIQSKMYQALLPKLGYNRHMPLTVVFGPRKYGGIGIFNFYTEQLIEHLRLTVLEIRKDTTAGKLLRIELDSLQLISGLQTKVLTSKRDSRLALPATRLTYLWHACSALDVQVEVFDQWVPRSKVEGDRSLMEMVLDSAAIRTTFTATQITTFNQCRMYARVIMLSDLTSPDGTRIDTSLLNGTTRRQSMLTWPRVPSPRSQDWRIWKEILHRTILI